MQINNINIMNLTDDFNDTPEPLLVRTNNGTEFANSEAFRHTILKNNYSLETTAPDSSSQNGTAEQPHRTLKTKLRCLLYTAGLSGQFWSYALRHVVWLYN